MRRSIHVSTHFRPDCKAMTGADWEEYSAVIEHNLIMKAQWSHRVQLASYLSAQLKMLAKMASGRSYNVINWLTRDFSYEMLVSVASNQ